MRPGNNLCQCIKLSAFGLFLFSCGASQKQHNAVSYEPVELPGNLAEIPDSTFMPLLSMLGNARLVGVTEGTHGMHEPLDFRNRLVKFLIAQNRIQVIAFESGIIESRLVNDYICGAAVNLDTVLENGLSCTFGQFKQNRDLLLWLREYNGHLPGNKKIHFYGFDMAGCASNPALEKSAYALHDALDFLARVDKTNYDALVRDMMPLLAYMRMDDNADDAAKDYRDLDSTQRDFLTVKINELVACFPKNKNVYTGILGPENFEWAYRSAICASQNIAFLASLANPGDNYAAREKFMFENLTWVMHRETGKRILLFAHLAHLSKDIYVLDAQGNNVMKQPMFGEHIGAHFTEDYKVIGNFYRELVYRDGKDSVKQGSLPALLGKKYGENNFYMPLNRRDTLFTKPRIFGLPGAGGDLYMVPAKGVDVILYTDKQHYFE